MDLVLESLEELGGERRIEYTLERLRGALAELNHPEKEVPTIIVAGTNGKGSTTLFLSSALRSAGYHVTSYLSPHLESPTERFLDNLCPIAEAELLEWVKAYLPIAKRFSLTYFEFLALIYFLWTQREKPNYSVLEVGLGGRLDATNVTQPIACALSQVGLDHQEYLGDSIEAILKEKLAIVPPKGSLFTSVRDANLGSLIEARCEEIGATCSFSKRLRTEQKTLSWKGQTITIDGLFFRLRNTSLGIAENAVLAFDLLQESFPHIPPETIQAGFEKVQIPGRMEVVAHHPYVVLSGDHNPDGINCLLRSLDRLGGQEKLGQIHTLCAFAPTKPFGEMFERLKEISDTITLTQTDFHRNSLPKAYYELGPFEPNPLKAVAKLQKTAQRNDVILITGSLYLVGEVRKVWRSPVEFLDTSPIGF